MILRGEYCLNKRASTTALVIGLLGAQALMLAWIGIRNGPGFDEFPHLASGLSHWRAGRFDLYRVNPPLVEAVAVLPLLFLDVETDWSNVADGPYARPEVGAGARFCELNPTTCFFYLTLARWMCIPFSVLGGIVVFLWARELYGPRCGLLALALWCGSPNVLGNGAMITADAAAASMGVMALYFFRRWLKEPTWLRAICSGIGLGIAELTKSTWIILFGLLPTLWVVWRLVDRRRRRSDDPPTTAIRHPSGFGLAIVLLSSIYVLNVGYGFEDTFKPLKNFVFDSHALGGPEADDVPGNRFADSWSGAVPVPLPGNYVRGIDVQRSDFERGRASYLRGIQKERGWWYWYLYALGVKVPLGTWLLAVLALIMAVRSRRPNDDWRDDLLLLTPAAAVLVLVASQTGFSRYLRYALPIAPFCYVWISQVVRATGARHSAASAIVPFATVLSLTSSLWAFPHSLSYFNEMAGGPMRGADHLLDANIDWGQDLYFLKRWYDANPRARPFHLKYFGFPPSAPALLGVDALPIAKMSKAPSFNRVFFEAGLEPGWYAISLNDLYGYRHVGNEEPWFSYLRRMHPVAMAGYSIYIYHLSAADLERIRSRPLPADASGAMP